MQGSVVVIVSMQHDFGPAIANRVDLNTWRIQTHDDSRADAKLLRRNSNTLSMITRRCGDDASSLLRFAELGHFVVGAAKFETVNRLHVFSLQADLQP